MSEEPLELHPEAEQEYRDAYTWYRERSLPAAEKFENAIEHGLGKIQESPERWPIYHSRFRKYTLREFPYTIFYRFGMRERSCWRLHMDGEGRDIGWGACERAHDDHWG